MTTYTWRDGQLEARTGGDSVHLAADVTLDGCDDLLVVRRGAAAYPAWLVPAQARPGDWPADNWSARLAACRTTAELHTVACTLTPAQAALLFATLPTRVLDAWTGITWPQNLAPVLYAAVVERFGVAAHEVPLHPALIQPPLDVAPFVPVDPVKGQPSAPGRAVPLDSLALPAAVVTALQGKMPSLYVHQALALSYIRAARTERTDVILSTPTASGKTMSFLPGILEELTLRGGTTLFLYPLTALCRDQLGTIGGVIDRMPAERRLTLKRFIGRDRLDAAEALPQLLVATPDKLNFNLHSREVRAVLANVKFIVLDEAHTYRGAFGTHMSAFLRRLLAVSGSRPALIVSSATLKNTVSFAQRLTGRQHFRVVGSSTAPRYPRHLYLAPAPTRSDRLVRAHERAVQNLGQTVRDRSSKGLVFVGSRGATRQVARTLIQRADSPSIPVAFPFYSNMREYDARLEQLRKGAGPVVAVSTSTLEAGIDIGELDVVGVLGFPRTRNAFKQMAGRAGRGGTAHVAFLPGTGPADEYYSRPESLHRLLNSESEPVHFNPHNPVLVADHVRRARYEASIVGDSTGPTLLERLYPEGLPEASGRVLTGIFDEPVAATPPPSLRGSAGVPHLVIRTGQPDDPDISVTDLHVPDDAPDWLVERSTLDNAHQEWGPDNVVMRGDRFYRVRDWRAGTLTEQSRSGRAVFVWVDDLTDMVVDPVTLARARRGLEAVPDGSLTPITHQGRLSVLVEPDEMQSRRAGEFITAQAGRGTVRTTVRDKRERSEQGVLAWCTRRPRRRIRGLKGPPEAFRVIVTSDGQEELLGTYDRQHWPLWESGVVDVPGAAVHTRQYHVVERVRRQDGHTDLLVSLHVHDTEVPGPCSCGATTEPHMMWVSSEEDVPDSWRAHPVFSMVPRAYETDVAVLTLRGAPVGALEALGAALVKALPDVLEVDPQEVGVHARSEHGEAQLLLWDTTVGGSGICTAIPDALPELLRGALTLLQEAQTCSCEGTGCFGCIQPLVPLTWSYVPEPEYRDDDDLKRGRLATDAALIFMETLLTRSGVATATAPVTAPPALKQPESPVFTQLLLDLDTLLGPGGTPLNGADHLLGTVLSSRLDVAIVTREDKVAVSTALETAFPAHAPRLLGTLIGAYRDGSIEALRHLVPDARPDRMLWVLSRPETLGAAQQLGVTSGLARWVAADGALSAGPDLLLGHPHTLLDALPRPMWYGWPLEQSGIPAEERAPALVIQCLPDGEMLPVTVLGRFPDVVSSGRFNVLKRARDHALSFKQFGTQAAEVHVLLRRAFPGHRVALVPSSRAGSTLGQGLTVLERLLSAAGETPLRLAWARQPKTAQKEAGGRAGRLRNVADAFAVPTEGDLQGKKIVLVDDIVTTGATLLDGRRALRAAGADVACFAVAHTLLSGRRS